MESRIIEFEGAETDKKIKISLSDVLAVSPFMSEGTPTYRGSEWLLLHLRGRKTAKVNCTWAQWQDIRDGNRKLVRGENGRCIKGEQVRVPKD